MNTLHRLLAKRIVILDGATGTNLLGKQIAPGESPSVLNIRDRYSVHELHRAYVEAGADVVLTNTFSANHKNYSHAMLYEVIRSGVAVAKRAAKKATVLADIGPLGDLIVPYGAKDFETVVNEYREICKAFAKAGLRGFFLETFTSIMEAKAAYLAARAYSTSIFICFSFQENCRTIMGDTPESIAVTFEALGAHGVGANCSSPDVVLEAVSRMAKVVQIPLIAKPNAGKATVVDGVVHNIIAETELANYLKRFVNAGVNMVGGCCGTTPEYIKAIAKKRMKPVARKTKRAFYLASPTRVIAVDDQRTLVVGERLNPSGRKRLGAGLKHKDYTVYGAEATAQEKAGADALDVNAFVDVLDERETLTHAVHEVIKASSLPLFIDTQDFDAAEAVLRLYPGLGVYNSVPARSEALTKWLRMIRRYGFKVVVSLIGKEIPKNTEDRMRNVKLTLGVAKKVGFPVNDLVFDPLVLPVATERHQIIGALETVAKLHSMGLRTILGISNVSYGLPDRSFLNAALTAGAIKNHVTFLILNPMDETVMGVVNASSVIFKDGSVTDFIRQFRKHKPVQNAPMDLVSAIVQGDARVGREQAEKLLDAGTSVQELVESHLAKALESVGDSYEKGKMYIPDLLKAAEVAHTILDLIKRRTPKESNRGTIVVATVKGDIHDIGKNLAGIVFKSAGYEVIDLGKDVATATIVKAARKHKPDFVGLSALLTTTMPEMENVVKALKSAKLDVRVIVGGPNVSTAYAEKIGAYGAARNAFEGLRLVRNHNRATR